MRNQALVQLYNQHIGDVARARARCDELNGLMCGPFLIAPHDEYWNATKRVAFVGQETKGWPTSFDISAQMQAYSGFGLGKRYHSSPFWNMIRKVETCLTGSTHGSAWLNVNRFDQNERRPSPKNLATLAELDFLLLDELKIIGAHVTVFFTGPTYDSRLSTLLNSTQTPVGDLPLPVLCQMHTKAAGGLIFRTYHPKYLRLRGLEQKVIDAIRSRALQEEH